MHFEELIVELGEFGPYQRKIYFLLCVSTMMLGWHDLAVVFLGATPEFRCKSVKPNLTRQQLEDVTSKGVLESIPSSDSSCYQYVSETLEGQNLEQAGHFFPNASYRLMSCQDKYEFSKSVYIETIVSEFQLVCDKKFWVQLLQSIFFAGGLAGSVIFGQISDSLCLYPTPGTRFGRKTSFLSAFLVLFISGTVASFAPNIYLFLVMYFFQGAANAGAYIIAITLSTEIVGLKYRVPVGIIVQSFHSIGFVTLSGIAYLIREWRFLEMAITFPVVFTILYWWFLPESIPWLLSQGRQDDVAGSIHLLAKQNGVSIGSDVVKYLKDTQTPLPDKDYYVIDCLRTWRMAKISLNVWFNWLVTCLVFYGLSLNTENMPGNHYLIFCIIVAVDIPADMVSIVLLNYFGRRKPLMITMVLAGVGCILSECLPNNTDTVRLIIVFISKFCITGSLGITRVMSVELFPTVIRSAGIGVASMSAGVGSIVTPIILDFQTYYKPLPLIIFGAMSIMAGLLALLFPETARKPLPQTLDDIDKD
ncbi:hypothetical protein Btru_020376 [Bulinus truncatus]|nr:hypothetical protein Btru_020376 [Bulinus truncatus]